MPANSFKPSKKTSRTSSLGGALQILLPIKIRLLTFEVELKLLLSHYYIQELKELLIEDQ